MKTASQLAALVGGTLDGDANAAVTGVSGLEQAQSGHLSFYGNQKYKKQLAETKASVVLVPDDAPARGEKTYIKVAHPHLAFARNAEDHSSPVSTFGGVSIADSVGRSTGRVRTGFAGARRPVPTG